MLLEAYKYKKNMFGISHIFCLSLFFRASILKRLAGQPLYFLINTEILAMPNMFQNNLAYLNYSTKCFIKVYLESRNYSWNVFYFEYHNRNTWSNEWIIWYKAMLRPLLPPPCLLRTAFLLLKYNHKIR